MIVASFAFAVASLAGQPAPPAPATVGEIDAPIWTATPSAQQRMGKYPSEAQIREMIGVAVLRCTAKIDGSLSACAVVCETPTGWGFGAAARLLAIHYRMRTTLADGRSVEGGTVTLPFYFNPPGMTSVPRCDKVAKPSA